MPSATLNRNTASGGMVCMPNVLLKSVFKAANDRLNVCHVNAGAIHPKIDEFRYVFDDVMLDLIIASETWFKSYRSNASVSLVKYEVVRNDRHAKRSGGVVIYIRKGLNYKVVAASEGISSEYLFIELVFPDSKILIGAYYKAPKVEELDVFETTMMELTTSYEDIIILGDFNENQYDVVNDLPCSYCVRNSCTKCQFSDALEVVGLKSIGSAPTHYPENGRSSLIDLFLTNRPEKVLTFNQISHGMSKHDIIFGSYACNKRPLSEKQRFTRNYSRINMDMLGNDFNSVSWSPVYNSTSVDVKIDYFNSVLLSLLDCHAPLLPFKKKASLSSVKPWFMNEIKRAITERDLAYLAFKNGVVPRLHYTRLRNAATALIKQAKTNFLKPKLDIRLGSKAIWKNLRNVGVVSSNNVKPCFTADEYNVHLTSRVADTSATSVPATVNTDDRLFAFGNVTCSDVARALHSIKSKAIGLDDIPIVFVKVSVPYILPVLTHIVNYCFTTSHTPKSWKLAKVIPHHKKTRSRGLDDFRPLSILSCLSKVLEILAKEQLVVYLQSNALLDRHQSGFRAKHSTETVLLHITDHIRRSFEKKQLTILLLLDFSKAFDTICHDKLLVKLVNDFSFASSAVSFIKDYLTDRMQCVSIDGHISQPIAVHQGIPQGSVLGPLIFSLYINNLPRSLRSMLHHMFADDVQLYYSFAETDFADAERKINEDISAVCEWARDNGLLLNVSKTQAIAFSNFAVRTALPTIAVNGTTVAYSDNVLNLGVNMDVNLLYHAHVKRLSSKVFSSLRSLWPNMSILTWRTRLMLVKSLIVPLFTYCDSVYATNLSAKSIRVLTSAFSSCIRFVFAIGRRGSVNEHLNRIVGCPIMEFLKYRRLVLIFKLLINKAPDYLYNKLQMSARSSVLILPRHSTTQYNKSFFVNAVSSYNALPTLVKQSSTLNGFKSRCFERFVV